jgi:hypothetical protein
MSFLVWIFGVMKKSRPLTLVNSKICRRVLMGLVHLGIALVQDKEKTRILAL